VSAPGQLFVSVVRSSTNTGVKNVTLDDLVLSRGGQAPPTDTTPPSAPSGLDAEAGPSGTEVELTWTPATDNVGVTGYQVLRDGQVIAAIEPATFFEDGVVPGHTYGYSVRAVDAAGNLGPGSNAVTVTTPLPPDVSAPSVPSGLVGSAAADGSRVDLSWVASSDDRGVAGYRVVRDGVLVAASVPGTSYADVSVVPGRTYQYVLRAFDAAGNVSGDSAPPLSVTTPAGSQVLRSESFSGADGSAWPAGWTSSVGAGGVVDVQGGGGRLQSADVANSFGRSFLSGVPAVADEELLTSYRWGQTSGLAYLNVWLRGSGGWQNAYRPASGYGLQLVSSSGAVVVSKNVGGVTSTLRSEPAGSRVSTAKQWLRFRVVGQQVMFRTWSDGQPEPAAWTWSGTDSSVSAPGQLFVSVVRSSTNTGVKNVTLDDLVLSRP
jgi:hypothetical protein